MIRRPDELRQIATNCRYLASNCITQHARKPLNDVADELDREADVEQLSRPPMNRFRREARSWEEDGRSVHRRG